MTKTTTNYRYGYHLSPLTGWMNDPNGLIYYQGRYHVFYQTNPFGNQPQAIHWGHVTSTDLLHWRQEDFALVPDQPYDQDGCFSGSAIVWQEQLYLFYTGHKNTTDGYEETQCVAYSTDGVHFEKSPANPIINQPPVDNTQRFRDPQILAVEKGYLLLIGGESCAHQGQVQVYQAPSLLDSWTHIGPLIQAQATQGMMWECPNYFALAGEQFLLVSPKGMINQGVNGFASMWMKGDFQWHQPLTEYTLEPIDYGQDFYAPQTFADPVKNRRLLLAWAGMPGIQEKEAQMQVGALTIPREITVKNGRLYFSPIEELKRLRETAHSLLPTNDVTETVELLCEDCAEHFALTFTDSEQQPVYQIHYEDQQLRVSMFTEEKLVEQKVVVKQVSCLQLFMDHGLTELFINEGAYTFTNKLLSPNSLHLTVEGTLNCTIYTLNTEDFYVK